MRFRDRSVDHVRISSLLNPLLQLQRGLGLRHAVKWVLLHLHLYALTVLGAGRQRPGAEADLLVLLHDLRAIVGAVSLLGVLIVVMISPFLILGPGPPGFPVADDVALMILHPNARGLLGFLLVLQSRTFAGLLRHSVRSDELLWLLQHAILRSGEVVVRLRVVVATKTANCIAILVGHL